MPNGYTLADDFRTRANNFRVADNPGIGLSEDQNGVNQEYRLRCAYEPTSIQIRISEEFLAKNPKAFRTIEQLLMEAVWRQGTPAEQIKASMKLFCN